MNSSNPIAQGRPSYIGSPACGASSGADRRAAAARGFTLIEMLVSLAITLIMMGAVVTLFGVITESVSGARSAIEMADRLRGAKETIQQDLDGATAPLTPPLRPEMDQGYFEIIEGQYHDSSSTTGTAALFGDIDDVLMFTTRNRKAPFLGKLNLTGVTAMMGESPEAEVIYFLAQDGPIIDATPVSPNIPVRLCTLYRRVLLVSPSLGRITTNLSFFYQNNDLSARYDSTVMPTMIPNTLGDLTKRENRFGHYGVGTYGLFPFLVDTTIIPKIPFVNVTTPSIMGTWPPGRPQQNVMLQPLSGVRLGDDVLLTNVLAFDVRVWDPSAPIMPTTSGVAVEPHDPGWTPLGTAIAQGAYVDIGYSSEGTVLSDFDEINPNAYPTGNFGLAPAYQRIYDTWSLSYENDGVDEDSAGGVDAFTNGLDDNNNGLVDDDTERDTIPPYKAKVRGIQVRIRTYEPNSQQVREAVVIQNFDTK